MAIAPEALGGLYAMLGVITAAIVGMMAVFFRRNGKRQDVYLERLEQVRDSLNLMGQQMTMAFTRLNDRLDTSDYERRQAIEVIQRVSEALIILVDREKRR